MKKLIVILALAVAAAVCGCGALAAGRLTMGTGGPAGTYFAFGGILSQYMTKEAGAEVVAVSTGGSKANIQSMDAGDFQLATVQNDVMAYAWGGTRSFEEDGGIHSFRVIGGLYAEAVQLVTTDPAITSVADLKGRIVSIGDIGSGVYFNAVDILGAAGLTVDDIDPRYQSFDASADSLKDGKISAAFITAGAPTAAISELAMTNGCRLVPIDGDIAAAILADCPYYTAYTIPAGTYNGQDEDVKTVTVKATMIVSADTDDDTVYALTKAIFDNADAIAVEHSKGQELSLDNAVSGMAAPFHAGAARYFAEKGIEVPTEG